MTINRRHVGFSKETFADENREAVLRAVHILAERRELPTMREIGKLSGLYSTSTVSNHLQTLEKQGLIERYQCKRGMFYLPLCSCRQSE